MSEPELTTIPRLLKRRKTLYQGQCCDCKVDTGEYRVWICRVAGGVTVEALQDGRWVTVAGGCQDTSQED